MGVVRREGDWRLEKHDDGVYEVTYQQQPELKIITGDYKPSGFNNERNDFTTPIRDVESFSEAEQLFEKTANGQPQSGFGKLSPSIPQGDSGGIDANIDLNDTSETPTLPPGGIMLIGIVGGGLALTQGGLSLNSPVSLFGLGLIALGVVILGLAYRVYASEGMGAAVDYLVTIDEEESQSSEQQTKSETQKTSPAPNNMKEAIYFERADQRCEWCEERTDSPEVHHIEPRSEGGPNEYDNLIGLCPTCHSKADKGGISKTKLRGKVSRQMEQWDSSV